jgi:hypothetical protein
MEKAKDIKLVILDVDGVMTDGRIVIDDNGVESRNFDIKDGMGRRGHDDERCRGGDHHLEEIRRRAPPVPRN